MLSVIGHHYQMIISPQHVQGHHLIDAPEDLKWRDFALDTRHEEYRLSHSQMMTNLNGLPLQCYNDGQDAEQSLVEDSGRRQIAVHFYAKASPAESAGVTDQLEAVYDTYAQKARQHNIILAKSYVASLKVSAKHKDLQKGSRLHKEILQNGFLQNNVFLGSALITMYAKCGALNKAQEVFDQLPSRTVVLWNSLITGYTQQGLARIALICFHQMQSEGIPPDGVTFACILKACGSIGALQKGKQVHIQIQRMLVLGELGENVVVASALVDMYAKCGELGRAQEVFDEFPVRDLVSWNALIAGYAQHGHAKEALKCFEQMHLGGFCPNPITFALALKACSCLRALDKGQTIHAQIRRNKLLQRDEMVFVALIDMYTSCGALEKAQEVFDESPNQTIEAWNSLISGYAQWGYVEEALHWFDQLELVGHLPDAKVFTSVLNACASMGAFKKGEKLHAQILAKGLLETDPVLSNALIDMYAKCNFFEKAEKVFDDRKDQNVIGWTTLISGYSEHGYNEKALLCYEKMLVEGFSPDSVTIICILKACANIGDLHNGHKIYTQIDRKFLLKGQQGIVNALVEMYAKCGAFTEAHELFDKLLVRDRLSWTALIAGYAEHGLGEQAMEVFEQMQAEGINPDAVNFMWILKVCGKLGISHKGHMVHTQIVQFGLLEDGTIPGTVLLVMYADCGMLAEARYLFSKFADHDAVSWNALMAGYAQLGLDETVLKMHSKMLESTIQPNAATYMVILSSCSHRGQLDKGEVSFKSLGESKNIVTSLEHYNCMIDLYARAGLLPDAIAMIELIPWPPDQSLLHSLMGACQAGLDQNFVSMNDITK